MLFDLHNDLLTGEPIGEIEKIALGYADRLRGVVLAFWSTNYLSLPEIRLPRRQNLFFAVEDMHFFTPEQADNLIRLSPVYCGLTWNYDNGLAGGAYSDGTLTERGKAVVRFLNRSGITVDLAHLNERSFFRVLELAARPIVSHTFVSELHEHKRNISFRQIEAVIEKHGIIGLTPINDFTGGGFDAYVRGVAALIDRFGDGHFAVSSDIYGSTDFPDELRDYDGYGALEAALARLGYGQKTINKIMYENAAGYVGDGGLP